MHSSDNHTTLAVLDEQAKRYSRARLELTSRLQALEAEVAALRRRYVPGIKRLADAAAQIGADLRSTVEDNPDLFVKPRTFCLHGVTVGYKKGAGKVDWDDDDIVVARIHKFFPDQADLLVHRVENPLAEGLKQLDAKDLAKIGARMEGTGDMVVVRTADTAIDKLVRKILSEGETPVEA